MGRAPTGKGGEPMPYTDGTLTPEDVATHLGATVDERMIIATETAEAMGRRRRSNTPAVDLWSDPVAHDGGVRYAALLWQSKAAPAGFGSYEPVGVDDFTAFARAMDHIGLDPVTA